jgi:hypothetical protein
MDRIRTILVDEHNELFDRSGMYCKEYPSDYRQIRYFTLLVVQKAPPEIREINLLEQQISELIKNAIKHGNKCDVTKKVRVWHSFTPTEARLIVEDEGKGFQKLEEWNEFNRRRTECFLARDFEGMERFVSYRTEESDDLDGGNALFASVEFWNEGVVLNEARNTVAVRKIYRKRRIGIEIAADKTAAHAR